ncbi:MAG: DUF89 family protein [Dehalococcoidia bacterium]|nr:DUF89 family protein [Dehalococcoidia bacterium]
MKTYFDCIPCFFSQALRAIRVVTDDEKTQRKVLDYVAKLVPELPLDVTPPEIAQRVYQIVAEVTGNRDPYREEKRQSNQKALSLYHHLKEAIGDSSDPVLTACKLAIAGNSIDMGPLSSYDDIASIADSALVSPLAVNDYEEFKKNIVSATHILYLGDNAGEIVFDRLLIEEIKQISDAVIHFVVRESPVINDVTVEDAVSVGIDKIATVISSGSDAPAVILSQSSPQMLKKYHSADVIISKGQGNYEALSGEKENIFFLLKIKCPVVANSLGLGVKNGDNILLKGQRLSNN